MKFLGFLKAAFAWLLLPIVALSTFGVSIVQGVSGVLTGNTDRPEQDWYPSLIRLDPNQSPFTNLLMALPRQKAIQPLYNLFEDFDVPVMDQVNYASGYSDSDTSIVVDNGAYFGSGALAKSLRVRVCRTREIIKVTSVSTNTLTVSRGAYSTTAAAILDNDWFEIMGYVITEGDTLPPITTTQPTTVTNNVQLFREAFGVTGTDHATQHRGGEEDLSRNMKMAGAKLKKQMENALRFNGARVVTGTAPATERMTAGFESFITTNLFDARGSLSKPDFESWMNQVFRYGSSEKMMFVGRNAMAQIDSLGYEGPTVPASETKIGLAIKRIESSFGVLEVIKDHSLSGGYADRIHIVDKANVALKELRPFQLLRDRHAPDYDGQKHEFLAEVGLWLAQEQSHAVIKNIGYGLSA